MLRGRHAGSRASHNPSVLSCWSRRPSKARSRLALGRMFARSPSPIPQRSRSRSPDRGPTAYRQKANTSPARQRTMAERSAISATHTALAICRRRRLSARLHGRRGRPWVDNAGTLARSCSPRHATDPQARPLRGGFSRRADEGCIAGIDGVALPQQQIEKIARTGAGRN